MKNALMPARLVTLKAQVSREAAAVWTQFLSENGITLGAYLQAAAKCHADPKVDLHLGQNQLLLDTAREIGAQRRKRS